MHHAVSSGNENIVKLLLNEGLNVNAVTKNSISPTPKNLSATLSFH